MSWGSEQNYQVTQNKTPQPPNENLNKYVVMLWLVLADLSLVASQNLFPVTSMLCLILASNS